MRCGKKGVGVAETKKRPDPAAVREKESLSPEEVAVVLNCGRTMAYKLIADGVIRSFRVGRLRRVRRQDVDAYMEGDAG